MQRILKYGIGGVSMITIYKDKKDIPGNKEYVELNDIFFNKNTVLLLDDRAKKLLFCVLALISGLILLAYGIYTLNKNTKRRRQKGE